MKIFPSKHISISLPENNDDFFNRLESMTEKSYSLITTVTNKAFIGQVNKDNFKIISSTIGLGALAVFELKHTQSDSKLEISLNTPFKVIMIILLTFFFGGISFSMLQIGLPSGLGLLIPLTMGVLMVRFVLFGLFFNISSNLGLRKLKNAGIKTK